MKLPGVIACGVPGAGGYDAVFALCIGDDAQAAVVNFWETYKPVKTCPLLGSVDRGDGLRREKLI